MKVKLVVDRTDEDGTTSKSEHTAIMNRHNDGYKLTYTEDLSGEGIITNTTMFISSSQLRILRRGELTTDFIYSEALVHNTAYETPFGNLPITLTTERYEYNDNFSDSEGDAGAIMVFSSYILDVGDSLTPPNSMNLSIKVTKHRG